MFSMKPDLLLVAIASTLTSAAIAETETTEVAPPAVAETKVSVADDINKDIKDYEAARQKFVSKLRGETDQEAIRALYQSAPKPGPYIERILALAEKNPKDPAAKKAVIWCSMHARKPENRQRVSNMLTTHYMDDPIINEYAKSLSRSYAPHAEADLRKIIEKTSNKDTKIYATYYLASKLGTSRLDTRLPKKERDAKAAESMKLMKQLDANPEVAKLSPRMAKRIASFIFENEKLGIGCTAPDIVGDDHTGTVFKLSDYRGKVVLLDFWGIW